MGKLSKWWVTADSFGFGFGTTYNPLPVSRMQIIQRTGDSVSSLLQHVGVNHRGRHVAVTQQLLNRADVGASLQEVRCKGVPEGRSFRYGSSSGAAA